MWIPSYPWVCRIKKIDILVPRNSIKSRNYNSYLKLRKKTLMESYDCEFSRWIICAIISSEKTSDTRNSHYVSMIFLHHILQKGFYDLKVMKNINHRQMTTISFFSTMFRNINSPSNAPKYWLWKFVQSHYLAIPWEFCHKRIQHCWWLRWPSKFEKFCSSTSKRERQDDE